MKRFNFLVVLVLLIPAFHLKAQEAQPQKSPSKVKHFIGAAAGISTGYGPTYQLELSRFKLQFTFTPYKSESRTQHSIGLTPKFVFFETHLVDVFAYQGNHLLYKVDRFIAQGGTGSQNNSVLINSIGAGITLGDDRPFHWQIMTGFLSRNVFERVALTVETALLISLNKSDWKRLE